MLKITSIILLALLATASIAKTIERTENKEGVVEFSNTSSTSTGNKRTVIYKSKHNTVVTFSDEMPSNVAFEILRFDCYACNPDSTINWHNVKLNSTAFSKTVLKVAKVHQVDPALVRALIHAESHFNPLATSRVGAQGLMQLMPATAKELGVRDSLDPTQNIQGGVKYIAQLLKQFNGNISYATAAYNAGPNAVRKYKGIPPYKETQVYVKRVAILHQRYKKVI